MMQHQHNHTGATTTAPHVSQSYASNALEVPPGTNALECIGSQGCSIDSNPLHGMVIFSGMVQSARMMVIVQHCQATIWLEHSWLLTSLPLEAA